MLKNKIKVFTTCLVLLTAMILVACGGPSTPSQAPSNNSAQRAREAAERSSAEMEGRPYQAPLGTTQQSSPQQNTNPGQRPIWIDSADSVFPRSTFITGVGQGAMRDVAEKNAFAAISSYFGQTIQADQTVAETFYEAMRSGATADYGSDLNIQNTVRTTTSLDALIGAEIRETWYDQQSRQFYALAVMERSKTIQIYTDLVNNNLTMINNLINMTPTEKNSMTGFARYQFAAVTADMNVVYGNILRLLNANVPAGITDGKNLRLESQNIAATIPIGIRVTNDKANRIQGAFAKAISDLGFRSGNANSRYLIEVSITTSPVELQNPQNNKFVRIEVEAELKDTQAGIGLLPWNFNDRQGHTSESEAENRAYAAAERKIGEEYKGKLSAYLSQLIAK